jgi:hypothetical protein
MARQAPPPLPRDSKAKPTKRKYLVTGPRAVNGVEPGEVVELELSESAIAALVEAGHVTPAPKDSAEVKQAADPEDEANLQDTGAGPKEPPANKKGK